MLLTCFSKQLHFTTSNQDGESPPRKVASCSSPPANQGLLLGIEHTVSQSTAQHGATQHIHLGTQGAVDTENTATHPDPQSHMYITNQQSQCPSCGKPMIGKNINRHLQKHCKSAAPGAYFSFRPIRRDFTSIQPQPSSLSNTAPVRFPCPHCHIAILVIGPSNPNLSSLKGYVLQFKRA